MESLPHVDSRNLQGAKVIHKYKGANIKAFVERPLDDWNFQIQYLNGMGDVLTYEELMKSLNPGGNDGT